MSNTKVATESVIEKAVQRIAVCYPTESLSCQVAQWAEGRDDCRVEPVIARSALAIRRSLDGADVALVDASNDHEQAVDLYSQAVARLGARKASVYTEQDARRTRTFRSYERVLASARTAVGRTVERLLCDNAARHLQAGFRPRAGRAPVLAEGRVKSRDT